MLLPLCGLAWPGEGGAGPERSYASTRDISTLLIDLHLHHKVPVSIACMSSGTLTLPPQSLPPYTTWNARGNHFRVRLLPMRNVIHSTTLNVGARLYNSVRTPACQASSNLRPSSPAPSMLVTTYRDRLRYNHVVCKLGALMRARQTRSGQA